MKNEKIHQIMDSDPKKNTTAVTVLTSIAAIIMLIGAFFALNWDGMTEGDFHPNSPVSANIGWHVIVIMLFVLASDLLLVIANIKKSLGRLYSSDLIFHSFYAVTGLFFSVATGLSARVSTIHSLHEMYTGLSSGFWDDDINWAQTLPDYAEKFSNLSTFFYIITLASLVATVVFMIQAIQKKK